MRTITKVLWIARVAALSLTPASAQPANLAKEGDYYAPSKTIVQRASPQELNEFKQGDYYAPGKTVVQQPTSQELNQIRQGDYYAPGG
jgi:hypothetical protein